MKFKSLFLCLLLLTAYVGAYDKWGAFSDPFPIRDATSFGRGLLVASDGGLRYRSVYDNVVYHSEHGLETSKFYSVVSSSEYGAFAVSEYGLVVAFTGDNPPWRVMNRSYVKNNVRAVPRGATLKGKIMAIAFEDRLAFFDVSQARSILTIDRICSRSLSVTPLRELLVRGDSLYARMDKEIYVRKMDWDNLYDDKHLSDPNSWALVPAGVSVEGFDEPTTKVMVDSEVLTDKQLYHDDGTSKVKWQVKAADGTYLIGSEYIFFKKNGEKKVTDLTLLNGQTPGEVYELKAVPQGGVLAMTVDGKLSYGSIGGWGEPNYIYGTYGNEICAYSARMKALSYLPDGHLFYHIWGVAYMMYSTWGNFEYEFRSKDDYCFEKYLPDCAISVSTIPAPDNSGFLATMGSNHGYGVTYFTKDGEVHCANGIGSNSVPGVMHSKIDENGKWVVYVANKNGTALANEGGLDVITFPSPKSNGGELADGVVKYYGGMNPAPVDMVYDPVGDRLWLVSMSTIAYLDDEEDSLMTPSSTNGLLGAEFTSIDVDVRGNLWVGTTNQGVYRLTPKNGSPDTLSVMHFTTKNGLLDNNVADLAVDPVVGAVWFAHEKGVSYCRRNDLKDASKNMTKAAEVSVFAYPVPFRPLTQAFLTIDGIAEKSTVSIYNRGGALIKFFRSEDILGGKVEWNGREKSGRLVAPGVYYYVVKKGSKVKKGKFIIAH